MPASIRIIKIVKDPVGSEAYTVEFECEADNAKDLLKELTASPYGQRAIELLNQAEFLPEKPNKTQEEIRTEAEKEQGEIDEANERQKELGRKEGIRKFLMFLRENYGDDFTKEVEKKLERPQKKEEEQKKEDSQESGVIQFTDGDNEPE